MDQGIPTGPSYERNNSSRRPTLHDINGLKKLSVLASSSQRNLNSSISNISLHKSNSLAPVIKSKRTHVSPPPDRKLIEISATLNRVDNLMNNYEFERTKIEGRERDLETEYGESPTLLGKREIIERTNKSLIARRELLSHKAQDEIFSALQDNWTDMNKHAKDMTRALNQMDVVQQKLKDLEQLKKDEMEEKEKMKVNTETQTSFQLAPDESFFDIARILVDDENEQFEKMKNLAQTDHTRQKLLQEKLYMPVYSESDFKRKVRKVLADAWERDRVAEQMRLLYLRRLEDFIAEPIIRAVIACSNDMAPNFLINNYPGLTRFEGLGHPTRYAIIEGAAEVVNRCLDSVVLLGNSQPLINGAELTFSVRVLGTQMSVNPLLMEQKSISSFYGGYIVDENKHDNNSISLKNHGSFTGYPDIARRHSIMTATDMQTPRNMSSPRDNNNVFVNSRGGSGQGKNAGWLSLLEASAGGYILVPSVPVSTDFAGHLEGSSQFATSTMKLSLCPIEPTLSNFARACIPPHLTNQLPEGSNLSALEVLKPLPSIHDASSDAVAGSSFLATAKAASQRSDLAGRALLPASNQQLSLAALRNRLEERSRLSLDVLKQMPFGTERISAMQVDRVFPSTIPYSPCWIEGLWLEWTPFGTKTGSKHGIEWGHLRVLNEARVNAIQQQLVNTVGRARELTGVASAIPHLLSLSLMDHLIGANVSEAYAMDRAIRAVTRRLRRETLQRFVAPSMGKHGAFAPTGTLELEDDPLRDSNSRGKHVDDATLFDEFRIPDGIMPMEDEVTTNRVTFKRGNKNKSIVEEKIEQSLIHAIKKRDEQGLGIAYAKIKRSFSAFDPKFDKMKTFKPSFKSPADLVMSICADEQIRSQMASVSGMGLSFSSTYVHLISEYSSTLQALSDWRDLLRDVWLHYSIPETKDGSAENCEGLKGGLKFNFQSFWRLLTDIDLAVIPLPLSSEVTGKREHHEMFIEPYLSNSTQVSSLNHSLIESPKRSLSISASFNGASQLKSGTSPSRNTKQFSGHRGLPGLITTVDGLDAIGAVDVGRLSDPGGHRDRRKEELDAHNNSLSMNLNLGNTATTTLKSALKKFAIRATKLTPAAAKRLFLQVIHVSMHLDRIKRQSELETGPTQPQEVPFFEIPDDLCDMYVLPTWDSTLTLTLTDFNNLILRVALQVIKPTHLSPCQKVKNFIQLCIQPRAKRCIGFPLEALRREPLVREVARAFQTRLLEKFLNEASTRTSKPNDSPAGLPPGSYLTFSSFMSYLWSIGLRSLVSSSIILEIFISYLLQGDVGSIQDSPYFHTCVVQNSADPAAHNQFPLPVNVSLEVGDAAANHGGYLPAHIQQSIGLIPKQDDRKSKTNIKTIPFEGRASMGNLNNLNGQRSWGPYPHKDNTIDMHVGYACEIDGKRFNEYGNSEVNDFDDNGLKSPESVSNANEMFNWVGKVGAGRSGTSHPKAAELGASSFVTFPLLTSMDFAELMIMLGCLPFLDEGPEAAAEGLHIFFSSVVFGDDSVAITAVFDARNRKKAHTLQRQKEMIEELKLQNQIGASPSQNLLNREPLNLDSAKGLGKFMFDNTIHARSFSNDSSLSNSNSTQANITLQRKAKKAMESALIFRTRAKIAEQDRHGYASEANHGIELTPDSEEAISLDDLGTSGVISSESQKGFILHEAKIENLDTSKPLNRSDLITSDANVTFSSPRNTTVAGENSKAVIELMQPDLNTIASAPGKTPSKQAGYKGKYSVPNALLVVGPAADLAGTSNQPGDSNVRDDTSLSSGSNKRYIWLRKLDEHKRLDFSSIRPRG